MNMDEKTEQEFQDWYDENQERLDREYRELNPEDNIDEPIEDVAGDRFFDWTEDKFFRERGDM